MDLTGRHLGKYELLERVGQGGMAFVYRAYQPTIDRHVAVKVLHSHLAEDATFLERFRREAKGLGSLRHPHIVSIIDFDSDGGWYYMVMDYIEGETLQAVLERRGALPVAQAVRLVAQLAGALDYAHRNGLVHRDIKPGNIMFADEAAQHAVITDFGLTRLLDNVSITLSGAIAGTPAYMSPEAAQGEKVDARGDIYSLGIVLYEMVTGRRPFAGETPLSIIVKLVLEPLPPASSIKPDLPPAIDAIIRKATAKKAEERYQTAGEMERALRQEMGDGKLEIDAGAAARAPERQDEDDVAASETVFMEPAPTAPTGLRRLPIVAAAALLLAALLVAFIVFDGRDEGQMPPATAPATHAMAEDDATPEGAVTDAPATAVVEANATPEAAVTEPAATPTSPTAQGGGVLRFAPAGDNGLRRYTLAMDNVPAPPAGSHYELWFELGGRIAPENVGQVAVQDGRIAYAGILSETLAPAVSGVLLSIEPDFDDDPSIAAVAFSGVVDDAGELGEITLFAGDGVD